MDTNVSTLAIYGYHVCKLISVTLLAGLAKIHDIDQVRDSRSYTALRLSSYEPEEGNSTDRSKTPRRAVLALRECSEYDRGE